MTTMTLINQHLQNNDLELAVKTACTANYRSECLLHLSKELILKNQIKTAEEVALLIKDDGIRSKFFTILSSHKTCAITLIKEADGDVSQAKEVAEKISGLLPLLSDFHDREKYFKCASVTLSKNGCFNEALDIARNMATAYRQYEAIKELITALVKDKKVDQACEVAAKYDVGNGDIFKHLVQELASNPDHLDRALEMAGKMPEGTVKNQTLQFLLMKLVEAGRCDVAIKAVLRVTKWDRGFVKEFTEELIGRGEVAGALSVVGKMPDGQCKDSILGLAVAELAKQGNFDHAFEQVKKIGDGSYKDDALLIIAIKFVERGQVKDAMEVADRIKGKRNYAISWIAETLSEGGFFDDAKEVTESISNVQLKRKALQAIARGLAARGGFEEAMKIANQPEFEGEEKERVVECISEELSKNEHFDKAYQAAQTISSDERKRYVLGVLSIHLTEKGHFDRAITVANGLATNFKDPHSFHQIAKALATIADTKEAVEKAHKITDKVEESYALCCISEKLTKEGNLTKALEIAHSITEESVDIETAINEIKGVDFYNKPPMTTYHKGCALRCVAEAYLQRGEFKEGVEVANAIRDWSQRKKAFEAISSKNDKS